MVSGDLNPGLSEAKPASLLRVLAPTPVPARPLLPAKARAGPRKPRRVPREPPLWRHTAPGSEALGRVLHLQTALTQASRRHLAARTPWGPQVPAPGPWLRTSAGLGQAASAPSLAPLPGPCASAPEGNGPASSLEPGAFPARLSARLRLRLRGKGKHEGPAPRLALGPVGLHLHFPKEQGFDLGERPAVRGPLCREVFRATGWRLAQKNHSRE